MPAQRRRSGQGFHKLQRLFGKGRYEAQTAWKAWQAIIASIVILVGASVVAAVVLLLPEMLNGVFGTAVPGAGIRGSASGRAHAELTTMLVAQVTMVLATLWAASRQGRTGLTVAQVLALNPVSARTVALALGGLLLCLGLYNGAVQLLDPGAWSRDLVQFEPFVKPSVLWLFALIVGLGAPLSEELLFRGFLLPALAQTRVGFPGAAILSSAGWTALHWGYSASGMLEVFIIGLFLSVVLWRSGSIWATIFCHGIYNLLLIGLLQMLSVAA